MNRREFFKRTLAMIGVGALANTGTKPSAVLNHSEVFAGLSREILYLPNGDSLALVGDTWYHGTDDRATWRAMVDVEEQLVDAYMRQIAWRQEANAL